MPATSVSHAIWFIASVTVAIVIVGALTGAITSLSDSMEDRSEKVSGELGTEIEIINDPLVVPYDAANNTLKVYLKNVGDLKITRSPSPINYSIVMFLTGGPSGDAYTPTSMYLVGGAPADDWPQGETLVAEFTVPGLTIDTDYRMEVHATSYSGVKDTLDFHIYLA